MTLGEPERAAYVIRESLALWHGPALIDLERWEPGRVEAGRLEELRLEAEEAGLDASLRAGRHRDVLGDAQALVAAAPLREDRWALLALAQYRSGRQGDALRTLHQARSVLARELGVDPGPDLLALEQAVLRHDPSLAPAIELPEPSASRPYRGLVPYDVRRRRRVLRARRRHRRLPPPAGGERGLGRRRAIGLRQVVARSCWRGGRAAPRRTACGRRHTRQPSDGRAHRARRQRSPCRSWWSTSAEEVVTLCDDAAERARFFAALVRTRNGVRWSWHYGPTGSARCPCTRPSPVSSSTACICSAPCSDDDLRAAIEGPARQAGLLLEPGLVDLLVREVEGEPGALPLLSHALRETWQRREGRTLTVGATRQTGGSAVPSPSPPRRSTSSCHREQRTMLRDLLLRLVSPGDRTVSRCASGSPTAVATDPSTNS